MYRVQVALMDAVPSVVAALDAHRDIVKVAGVGLCFLNYLASTHDSMVTS